jgi:hypothetical protein
LFRKLKPPDLSAIKDIPKDTKSSGNGRNKKYNKLKKSKNIKKKFFFKESTDNAYQYF